MSKLNPQEFAEKWARRLGAATPDIEKGVDAVTESPMAKAAAKEDKWLMGIQEAAASGKWRRGLARVSLEDWKKQMKEKGLSRLSAGVAGAKPKMAAFAEDFLPFLDKVQAEVAAMADVTFEDAIARMTMNARRLKEYKRST